MGKTIFTDDEATPRPSIRVMVVDDHAVVRGGLTTFLLAYDDLELVGEAANGLEALTVAERCQPDVVLMDLMMPEMDGATATRLLREKHPNIQVIALTSFKEDDLVPVSYTHLDVYKRQGQCRPSWRTGHWHRLRARPSAATGRYRHRPYPCGGKLSSVPSFSLVIQRWLLPVGSV